MVFVIVSVFLEQMGVNCVGVYVIEKLESERSRVDFGVV